MRRLPTLLLGSLYFISVCNANLYPPPNFIVKKVKKIHIPILGDSPLGMCHFRHAICKNVPKTTFFYESRAR